MSEPVNPYAPPASELSGRELSRSVPRDPVAQALAVLTCGPLLAGILGVSIPVNLVIQLWEQDDFTRKIGLSFIDAYFASISIGMVFETCRALSQSEPITLRTLLSAAVPAGGRIFVASLVANLIVVLGFLALVIPGLVLLVRYGLVEVAVFRERLGPSAARARSTALVAGRGWAVARILYGFLGAATLVPTIVEGLRDSSIPWAPALDHFAVYAAVNTFSNLIYLGMFAPLWALFDEASAGERAEA